RVYAPGEKVERNIFVSMVEPYIITLMSGVIAEHVVLHYRHEVPGDEHDRASIETYRKIVRWPGGWRSARKRLQGRTQELVEQHRDAIRRVAFALRRHRKLDGSAIDAITRG